MPREEAAYFLDMFLAGQDAISHAAGLSKRQFEKSRLHQDAVVKALEVIGEAAARISLSTRDVHADIPWGQIIGMRNRLVHAYFELNLDIVWETVQVDVPVLVKKLEPLIPPEELQH